MAYNPDFTNRAPKDTFASIINTDMDGNFYNCTGSRVYIFNGTSSHAISASWAPSAGDGVGTTLYTGSTYPITASGNLGDGVGTTLYTGSTYQITSSRAISASWAPSAGDGVGTTLYTASTYQITSSWSQTSSIATNVVGNIRFIPYTPTMSIDFNAAMFHTSSVLTGDVYITANNLGPGKMGSLKMTSDGTLRNIFYPSSWVWLETVPIALSASKTAVVSVVSYGSTNADIVAVLAKQL